jgi:hypothetical protein
MVDVESSTGTVLTQKQPPQAYEIELELLHKHPQHDYIGHSAVEATISEEGEE